MSKTFIPFMDRLTPAQRRKFRAGMARLRRQLNDQIRAAKKYKRQIAKPAPAPFVPPIGMAL
jgi:hypothetical protein